MISITREGRHDLERQRKLVWATTLLKKHSPLGVDCRRVGTDEIYRITAENIHLISDEMLGEILLVLQRVSGVHVPCGE